MADYLHPGVFVEEKPSGAKPIEAASTSTAAFVGTAVRGRPGFPTFVSSWFQFKDAFGDVHKNHDLPLAIYHFFQNGGSRAYILRVVSKDAAIATATVPFRAADGGATQNVTINAAGAGAWGSNIVVTVQATPTDLLAQAAVLAANGKPGAKPAPVPDVHFDILVKISTTPGGPSQLVESWTSLDATEGDSKFYATIINRHSNYIAIVPDGKGNYVEGQPTVVPAPPAAASATPTANATASTTAPAGGTGAAAGGAPAAAGGAPAAAGGAPAAAGGAPAAAGGAPAAAGGAPAAAPTNSTPKAATAADISLAGGSDGVKPPTDADYVDAFPALNKLTDASLLVVPGVDINTASGAASYVSRRATFAVGGDMFYIMDPPSGDGDGAGFNARETRDFAHQIAAITACCQTFPTKDTYSGLYFPWVEVPDLYSRVSGATRFAPPSGMIAGLFARTDNARGVWKAPAGTEASLLGAVGLAAQVSDQEQDTLNPIGVNCIRQFAASGIVCWGTRTLGTLSNPEYRYVPIRRTANFLKTSLYRGTQWVVFEPNDEPLWSSIRFNLNAFMSSLFRAGAFQGTKPEDAFFVKCDKDNNTQATIDQGQVHILVGFAPLKPAEFVIIQLQQIKQ